MEKLLWYIRSKSTTAVALVILLGLPIAAMAGPLATITSPNKKISFFDQQGGFATISGRWKATKVPAYQLPPTEINTVRIYCNRTKKICTETVAYMRVEQDKKSSILDVLDSFEYKITQWTDSKIVAVCKGKSDRYEMIISLKEKTAERIMRSTGEVEGPEADSTQAKWILE